jgi:catechol 2,3-dioxygenase-like lactoylglutathione lyase family enzyme
MRIDHIAYRVADRKKTTDFFVKAFSYRISDEFEITFSADDCAKCYALSPIENLINCDVYYAWTMMGQIEYHLPPEIFISQGSPGSIVDTWVKARSNIGGVHHIAYQVSDVKRLMSDWKKKELAEFTTEEPIISEGLVQCFTKPHPLTGIIYEFIYRTDKGFNVSNVKKLMDSTRNLGE